MQKRIEFIDLAKGICILEIVCGHCGLSIDIPGFQNLRMPLYFVLSGIFFKTYSGFRDFIHRKTNKILVPFLFFYILAYIAFYVAMWLVPELIRTDASGIFDVFTQRQYFNGPIWFLICLFWTNIYFYLIHQYVNSSVGKLICVLLVSCVGLVLGKNVIFLPCMMDVAMSALPFFYFGYLLKKTNLLIPNRFDQYNLLFAILLWIIVICMERFFDIGYLSFHYNRYRGIYLLDLISAVCAVLSILYLCKSIKYLPLVSFCGRYSIILLCTHHMYYRPLIVVLNQYIPTYSIELSVVITVALCVASIPLCRKYIPKVCAQKDLF